METRSLLTTIARQIDTARNHAGIEERRSDGAGFTGAVLRSLRVTYVALASGLDPLKDATHLFILKLSATGDPVLLQADQPVPVDAPYLAYLFWTAGVELVPGEVLLLDPELAKEAIEEALGVVALEQAFTERERMRQALEDVDTLQVLENRASVLWDRKIELIAACLVADEYVERVRAFNESEEAA